MQRWSSRGCGAAWGCMHTHVADRSLQALLQRGHGGTCSTAAQPSEAHWRPDRWGAAAHPALHHVLSHHAPSQNMLVCAPTGAGKTNVAMLTILHEIGLHR